MSYKRNTGYAVSYFVICITVVGAIILFALWFTAFQERIRDVTTSATAEEECRTFVIDPGHGGEDGGAFATDGTAEKDLNLSLSSALFLLFELNGNKVKMTRTEDKLLYDYYNELDSYKGKKKIYDLKNRVMITKELKNPVYIGIHMNTFSSSAYSGLQVYYSKEDKSSLSLAEAVQSNTAKYIQKDNKRRVKAADSSIYILSNLECPAVLIECGFLSNDRELSLLKKEEYRRDLASVIFASSLFACIDKE